MNNEEKILEILSRLETDVGSLRSDMTSVKSDIKTIDTRLDTMDAKIEANRDEMIGRFDNLDSRIARNAVDLKNSIQAVYACLDVTERAVSDLQQRA